MCSRRDPRARPDTGDRGPNSPRAAPSPARSESAVAGSRGRPSAGDAVALRHAARLRWPQRHPAPSCSSTPSGTSTNASPRATSIASAPARAAWSAASSRCSPPERDGGVGGVPPTRAARDRAPNGPHRRRSRAAHDPADVRAAAPHRGRRAPARVHDARPGRGRRRRRRVGRGPAPRGGRGDRPPRGARGAARPRAALVGAGVEPAQRVRDRGAVRLPRHARRRARAHGRRPRAGGGVRSAAHRPRRLAPERGGVLGAARARRPARWSRATRTRTP